MHIEFQTHKMVQSSVIPLTLILFYFFGYWHTDCKNVLPVHWLWHATQFLPVWSGLLFFQSHSICAGDYGTLKLPFNLCQFQLLFPPCLLAVVCPRPILFISQGQKHCGIPGSFPKNPFTVHLFMVYETKEICRGTSAICNWACTSQGLTVHGCLYDMKRLNFWINRILLCGISPH